MAETSYREHLQSLGFSRHRGGTKTTVERHERDGSVAGYHVERWDDSVAAVVTPKHMRLETTVKEV
jgi:hypothetical protein